MAATGTLAAWLGWVARKLRPRLRLVAVVLAAAISAPALAAPCSGTVCLQPGMDQDMTIQVGLLQREFLVHVPANYSFSRPAALVLDMHGYSGTAAGQKANSGQLQQSDLRGFIAVWPKGVQKSWNGYGCCAVADDAQVDDVKFLRDVIAPMKREANVDPAKVYVTGVSNGGSMALRMACEAADVVQAAAPVSFPLNTNSCRPSRPISVIEFASLGDMKIPYEGEKRVVLGPVGTAEGIPFAVESAPKSLADWAKIDGCKSPSTRQNLAPGATHVESYTACKGGSVAGLVTLDSPPHVPYGFRISGQSIAEYMWTHLFKS